jgi:archaemetzincin
MKSISPNAAFNSKHICLEIIYFQISNKYIKKIQSSLEKTYGDILNIIMGGELEPPKDAYDLQRNQYNADILLSYLLKIKKTNTALWVIKEDIYCRGINFVFGLALRLGGAVLSIHRLSGNDLIEKEANHEVGHILGLQHCSNYCVMQFSNSLFEAKMKPLYLCESCRRKITFL